MGILCGGGGFNLNCFSLKIDLIYTGIKSLLLVIMGRTFKGTALPNNAGTCLMCLLEISNMSSAVELTLLPPLYSLNRK